ncbi:hypothetical protein PC128_g8045 [Phytophthora cactorum]|nr:hypothetical protein PC128_g8045 [Phytophthora cactorum]
MLVEAYSDAEYAADKTDRTSVTGGTTAERLGIIELLQEINVETRTQSVLHVSNLAAIAQIEGENTSGRAKHIDVRLKFVKDIVDEQRSAPLVAASTTEQEIQRVCTGATSDGAALEDCGAALPGLVALAYPVQAESNGVEKELEPLQHSVPDARESSGARVNGDSAQDDEGPGYD